MILRFTEKRFKSFRDFERSMEYLEKYMRIETAHNKRSNKIIKALRGVEWSVVPGIDEPQLLSSKWRMRLYRLLGSPVREFGGKKWLDF